MCDLINRGQAIDSICINICGKSHDNCGFWKKDFEYCPACRFAFLVGNTPSAEKTGRWIKHDDGYNDTIYQCSVCGEEFVTIEGTPADNLWNYCSNCGARMED